MKSSRHCALRCSSSASCSCSSVAPAAFARLDRVEQRDDRRAAALHQVVVALLDQVDAREDLRPPAKWWQVWQARLMLSSGLRTQWSETLVAPSRM